MRMQKHADAAPKRQWWRRPPRLKPTLWTVAGVIVFCIIVMGVSAFIAKSAVDSMVADARQLTDNLGDREQVSQTVDGMRDSARNAHIATSHPIWRASEIIPFIGDDLRAVRLLAGAADELISDVAAPLLELDLSSIGPTDGALNVDAVAELGERVEEVAPTAERLQIRLVAEGIETEGLLAPLRGPVDQVLGAIDTVADVMRRVAILSPQLPTMLGADEPRNYLVLVQNTAEMRTLGGNPGTLLMMTLDQGAMSITNSAGQADVSSGRPEPIVPLAPSTQALYTDRVGRYIQDTTMTPDFGQTAHIARAFWSDTIGDPGHSVLAIDPVLLSNILRATGPVQLPTGETLNADNAVEELLSNVYARFPGDTAESIRQQDEFFVSAASAIVEGVTHAQSPLTSLVPQLTKAFQNGRILYAPTDRAEAKAVAGTLFNGPLYSSSNRDSTTIGVFVNDNTEGKLDYYTDMSVAASTDVCEADAEATFTAKATYNYTLEPGAVAGLPAYVSTGRYFPKGIKSTNLVFYGPVGSSYISAKVDGEEFVPQAGTDDLGRAAVLINFESEPSSTHTIEVTFSAPIEDEEYGPLAVAHTPMLKKVPVEINAPGCG